MPPQTPSIEDFERSLRQGQILPLYLLTGDESFLVDEALRLLISAALTEAEQAFNLDILSGDDFDARDIVARASAFPLMSERRVVVVRDVERCGERGLEILAHYVESPSPTTCLVLTASKADMRRKVFALIRKKGMALEFKELSENRLPGWIEQRVRKRKGSITPDAAKLLTAYVGSSLRDLDNELEKLFLFLGDRTSVTADDVAVVVGFTREYNVFELQKAVGEKNIRRSATILERILDSGERIPMLISILTSYFATLWRLADCRRRGVADRDLAAEAKVNPYFLKEYLDVLHRYSTRDVERAFEHLVDADEQSKSTGTDPKQIMHTLLVRLIGEDDAGRGVSPARSRTGLSM